MAFAFQHNKNLKEKKRFFMIWKCNGEYFFWELNWGKKEYYVKDVTGDFGHGFNQFRHVINVKVEYIKHLSTLSL
jgi:hypothetical protein